MERATGAKTFLHADRLGSIIATASNDGAITGQAKYSPWGVTTGSIPTMFGYTGHQYDREIGIYYARARTYMPLIGRFMQVDPVGYKQSLNLYTYGMGNPMAGTDPSGGFFIGLGIAAIQFAIGELTATAFLSTIAEIAIGELVTRGLDMLIPGAGQVLGIVRTVVGFITSPGFGGGAGAIKNAAHGGPVNGGGLSGGSYGAGGIYSAMMGGMPIPMIPQSLPDQGVTGEQWSLLGAGKTREFWESRLSVNNDPLAEQALAVYDNTGSGVIPNQSVIGYYWRAHGTTPSQSTMRMISHRIAEAHARAVTSDIDGTPGLLSAQQIARYHHEVFAQFDLPASAFAGTPAFGFEFEAGITNALIGWCTGCDPVVP